jgi:spoIIIJ-associated protein
MEKRELIKATTQEILALLALEAQVAVTETAGIWEVKIETPDSGILIGYHGEVLAALQLLLGQIVQRRLGEWLRIVVDIDDYRKKREQTVRELALATAQQVEAAGQACALPPMPANERRVAHLTLAEHPGVETISEGEGNWRRVIIQPKAISA